MPEAQLRLPINLSESVHIGADISLWNPIVVNWLNQLTHQHPSITAHTEVAATEKLVEQLQLGNLDAIVVHQPNYYSGLTVEQVAEEKLVHVRSTESALPNLFIDWGADFKNKFDAALPVPRQAALSFNLGPLALKFMLSRGGNGYFRTRVVETYLRSGQLEMVPNSPEFSYPIYVIYRAGQTTSTLKNVISSLKISLDTDEPWVM
ncbi:substrate-binding domain-containing protein [Psychrosphaera algicola]|uniref:Substrate-binding domain-containing protein n=1 Tax=Psychrosphaera algicola TaxID=3023714 RepID=A0ABT5FFX2_9GAMM|nr:substrate-binding domain-containing protein [Psychrosphaera sp. G1-22]MDC2889954.1 substrate-binding domain-containing protein [Psychrosphaera sp. G1-22]